MRETTGAAGVAKIPEAQANAIRKLAHDLSNALEIIVQSSYLLSTTELDELGRKWVTLLDQGTQQAAGLNRELREYIRNNT
ncbi:MAG TPA: hypothetical protein VNX22_09160 [Acidobacteriaceae bacterium]|nr:hypothetical protein [Acidobacteriaceae bacterium]